MALGGGVEPWHMPPEPVWTATSIKLEPGEYTGTVVEVANTTSQAGNAMVVWTFVLPGGQRLNRWTLWSGPGASDLFETVQALGLPRRFKASDAIGRTCTLVVVVEKGRHVIERCKAPAVPL